MASNKALRPKFVTAYENLLQLSSIQLKNADQDQVWIEVFSLGVEKAWLSERLHQISQEDCLGRFKPFLNLLCRRSLQHFSQSGNDDPVKRNALETLVIFVRCLLAKQMSGWEIMDVFAGGVVESDTLFANLTKSIADVMGDEDAPVELRHRTLQLGLVFMCGVSQLSPGAYFLRRDIYPSLKSMVVSPKTGRFTFEATLLLTILSNFHRSDAAKTNPYLNHIKQSPDVDLMVKFAWIIAYATQKAASAYQDILDDSPPTIVTSFTSMMTALRPDRALSATPLDPPRELFKNQPIEASVVLLPLSDLLHYNEAFKSVFIQSLEAPKDAASSTPLPVALLSSSSYLLTHASSTASPRALAYAHLNLTILSVITENKDIMTIICRPPPAEYPAVRLCRQRAPYLPYTPAPQPLVCALLDCCVLWLRHNLHKRFEVASYLTCIRVIHRVIWFLTQERLRLEYHWEELWRALFTVMEFLASQSGSMKSIAKVDELVQETICLLEYTVRSSEHFLHSPQALHQLVYEVVRSAGTISKQRQLLKALTLPASRRSSLSGRASVELATLEKVAEYYQKKLSESNPSSAKGVLKVIGQQVDTEGVKGIEPGDREELAGGSSDESVEFVRWACIDGLALVGDL